MLVHASAVFVHLLKSSHRLTRGVLDSTVGADLTAQQALRSIATTMADKEVRYIRP